MICLVVAWATTAGALGRDQAGPSVWDGVYAEAQATRGAQRYRASCASCHSEDLLGGSGPALVGESFSQRWNGTSVADMLQTLRQTMPQDSPDSLGVPGYLDVVAYLLKSNSIPAGAAELPPELPALQQIRITQRPR
jgi:mono/diheme cytochrome c family protein